MKTDDPRLTAYALGELEGAEAAQVAAAVEADPLLQEEVEEIRRLAGQLQEEYADEEGAGLRPEQVARLEGRAGRRAGPLRWTAGLVGMAATLLFLGLLLPGLFTSHAGLDKEEVAGLRKDREASGLAVPEVEEFDVEIAQAAAVAEKRPADSPFDKDRKKDLIGIGGGYYRGPGDELPREPNLPGMAAESYDTPSANPFRRTDQPGGDASTFSIDVDTAAYANLRRLLTVNRMLPPPGAVRIEEMINYFDYAYDPPPAGGESPFAVHTEVAACPWQPGHRLVRIALKGREIETDRRPASNLVFLIDTSGSMRTPRKLPLLREGFKLLVRALDERDRVAMVTYAGSSGLALPSTTGDKGEAICAALDRLEAGGSTNGGAGIELAYRTARRHLIAGGNNRVILATDGDFNVGISDRSRLAELIGKEASRGVELTILGFGTGNYKDATMEELSNKGDGNYHYIDSLREARKVLVEELTGTLVTIARDVKIQVFFNPAKVAAWRLLGYENRRLARQDFNDDTKDAGEIGAGHTVTALYQVVPRGVEVPGGTSDPNPFVKPSEPTAAARLGGAWMRLRLRHKPPEGEQSLLQEFDIQDRDAPPGTAGLECRWAAAVAGFGMLLRRDKERGLLTWAALEEMAAAALGPDPKGYRAECLELIRRARELAKKE